MNSKHLSSGEACPSIVPGSLRIYSMRFCPYAQRALLVASAKGIKHDIVNINLMQKPEFMFMRNPEGKVPTIESEDGKVLYESLIVSEYIDAAYNTHEKSAGDSSVRHLNPIDPFQKSVDRIWIEKFSKVISIDYQLYFQTDLSPDQILALLKQLNEQLMIFENELQRRGTKFFAGSDKPGMLDYMIWPWMERFPCLQLILANHSSPLLEGRSARTLLGEWEQDMIKDEAVKASYLPPDAHAKYRQMRRQGGLDYEFLHRKK